MKCNHCGHDFYGHTPTADPDVMNCPGCYGGKCATRKKFCLRFETPPDGSIRIMDLSLVDDDHAFGHGGDYEHHTEGRTT